MNTFTCKDNKHQLPGEQAFIVTLAEAREMKFHFDNIKKELKHITKENTNIRFHLRQITALLNSAKKGRSIILHKKQ